MKQSKKKDTAGIKGPWHMTHMTSFPFYCSLIFSTTTNTTEQTTKTKQKITVETWHPKWSQRTLNNVLRCGARQIHRRYYKNNRKKRNNQNWRWCNRQTDIVMPCLASRTIVWMSFVVMPPPAAVACQKENLHKTYPCRSIAQLHCQRGTATAEEISRNLSFWS